MLPAKSIYLSSLLLLLLQVSLITSQPTHSYLQRADNCTTALNSTRDASIKGMESNRSAYCDPTKRLVCLNGKCDCDPLLAKRRVAQSECLGLYSSPCTTLFDSTGKLSFHNDAGCYDGLECSDKTSIIKKLIAPADGGVGQGDFQNLMFLGQSYCKCKKGVRLDDFTCSDSGGTMIIIGFGLIKYYMIGMFSCLIWVIGGDWH